MTAAERHAESDRLDDWLRELLDGGPLPGALNSGSLPPGTALAAVGALGRREIVPGSDLDLVFLHQPGSVDGPARAQQLWYRIWDSPWSLDHSVRTPDEAIDVAATDLKAALGLLDLRHVAGDGAMVTELRSRVRAAWVTGARTRLPELLAAAAERASRFGELAFLLEPDLKEARGGLRDGLIPRQAAAAQVVDLPPASVTEARELLLDVRGVLHARAIAAGRKASDRLMLQDQDGVAADLGYPGADELMAGVAEAARTTAYAIDQTRRRVTALLRPTRVGLFRRSPSREPVAPGLVTHAGEVLLSTDADPAHDSALVMRAARVAAETGFPLAERAVERLAQEAPGPSSPWEPAELNAFVALLGAGHAAVPVIETLDAAGIWEKWMPEWSRVRSRPQRNAFHRFTVDRHMLESAAEAAAFTREVARPDLLLIAGLLHDLGKGWPGEDHTDAGVREVPPVARRMGLSEADVDTLTALVRCHITLAELATTRDTHDPATAAVLASLVGSRETLELLRWLTQADSLATGPAMWSAWKANLLNDLVRRTTAVLTGSEPEPAPTLSAEQTALVAAGTLAVEIHGDHVTVVAPDHPGLLAIIVGVLGLQRLDVRGLNASIHQASAQACTGLVFAAVTPRFGGELPDPSLLREELARALSGQLDVAAELAIRAADYPVPARALLAPARVLWDDQPTGAMAVVQVRAADRPGLLARVADALHGCGLQVHLARCTTLGAEAIDAFYVTEPDGGPVASWERRDAVAAAVLAVA